MASNKSEDNFCFLQVSVAGRDPQTITIQLFPNTCPQTCRNFTTLCDTPEDTVTTKSSPQPTYRGCLVHRVIPNFMVQTGDFERFDGTGGYSPVATGGVFKDESFRRLHNQAGVVSMANSGKHTNKSQFFITLQATPHLNGKHVVFGQVVDGMDAVHQMAKVEREGDRPTMMQRIIITDCGIGKKPTKGNKIEDEDSDEGIRKSSSKRKNKDKKDRKQKKKKKSSSSKNEKKKRKRRSRDESNSDDDDNKDDGSDSESSSSDDEGSRKRKGRKHHRKLPSDDSDSDSLSSRDRRRDRKKRKSGSHDERKSSKHRHRSKSRSSRRDRH
eukprot:CAMPEP_0198125384 /NCGR_PEP_ID=MMETSP1442-20131203/42463_1 /TAXON_ID= /ORGANISM="Craspedostauros australis, Strain CCMP3328" /LENGTH=326 /DNA_ID=CAMNT_0043784975 /DNA_START=48 /DNA_END=1028 /DNA_ORIENTATION=+